MPKFRVSYEDGTTQLVEAESPEAIQQGNFTLAGEVEQPEPEPVEQPEGPVDLDLGNNVLGDIGRRAIGVGEAGLAMASAGIAQPVSGIAGMLAGLVPGMAPGTESRVVEGVQDFFSYQPRTREGQEAVQFAGETAGAVFEPLSEGAEAASESVYEATDSPLLASMTQAGIEALPDLIPATAGVRAARAARLVPDRKLMPTDELFEHGSVAGDRMRQAGVEVDLDSLDGMLTGLNAKMQQEALNPVLHPKASAVRNTIEQRIYGATDAGDMFGVGTPSFEDVYSMRRIAANAISGADPDDARILTKIRNHVDDYLDNMDTKDITGGDVDMAVQNMRDMKDYWRRARAAEDIEELMRRAEIIGKGRFTQSGVENALRQEFSRVAKNKKQLRRYPKELQDAIVAVAEGSPVDNVLRYFGKFKPTGVISTAVGIGGGYALGGAPMAVAAGTAGYLGRLGAEAMTVNRAQRALQTAQRGGAAPIVDTSRGRLYAAPLLGDVPENEDPEYRGGF